MKKSILPIAISAASLLFSFQSQAKPSIWVISDMSDPRAVSDGNRPNNDPDDIVSMAGLLLESERYNILGITVGSTGRKNLPDPMPFVNETFVKAYENDLNGLKQKYQITQTTIPFVRSSLSMTATPIKFNATNNYADISSLPSIVALANKVKLGPVYILNWGPLTESAILIKHLQSNNNNAALDNITLVSHWTSSTVSQGSISNPFNVANCNDDRPACDFIHKQAATAGSHVKMYELGSTGQGGLVTGSGAYATFNDFNKSALGQIFLNAKFAYGKPDQSDGATHFVLNNFGITLSNFNSNGTLTNSQEKDNIDIFKSIAQSIISDLMTHSMAASNGTKLFSEDFIASYFTYLYSNGTNKAEVHCPYSCTVHHLDKNDAILKVENFQRGNHSITAATNVTSVKVTCKTKKMTIAI